MLKRTFKILIFLSLLLATFVLQAKEVLIIDKGVADYQSFIDSVKKDTDVIILEADKDALDQITASLQDYKELDAIHIVSHGNSGELLLGTSTIDLTSIRANRAEFEKIGASLGDGGDIFLYGCNVASAEKGIEFINLLSQVTVADISASNDVTGSMLNGGDWVLEESTGPVSDSHLFSENFTGSYPATLAVPADGLYTFIGAVQNPGDGTATTADGFFTIDRMDGSGNSTAVSADAYGAFINYGTTGAIFESYLEVKVATTGSFYITDATIGEYEGNGLASTNNFSNVYLAGYANGIRICETSPVSSIGVYEVEYVIDYTPCLNKLMDSFRTYFTNDAAARSYDFNLVDFTLSGASTNEVTPSDLDATVTASATVVEPISLASTVDTVAEAVAVFDFTITDGGTADGYTTDISQIRLNTSGTGDFAKITWRLNGPDATNVTGVYNSGSNTLTFSGLTISVADGGSETYTVNGYYSTPTGLVENATFILSVDGDTDLTLDAAKTQMAATTAVTNGSGTITTVNATKLVFTTEPGASVSGVSLTQPVVKAVDSSGNVDTDYTGTITLSEASAGVLTGTVSKAAVSGVSTYTDVVYSAFTDQESFTLTATDGSLTDAIANSVTSDVVATKLVFDTQPAPLTVSSGVATSFTTVPVLSARDANNVVDTGYSTGISLAEVNGAGSATLTGTGDTDGSAATVTITPSSGVATFTALQITYTASGGSSENFNLQASSGGLTVASSSQLTGLVADSDGSLTTAAGVTEPVAIATTVDTVGEAVNVFDFTLSDGGSTDGLAMTVSDIVLNTSGTSDFSKITWRLNGPDATNVTGSYNAGANTITFSGLSISIADGGSEVYTVNAYFNDNTGISENSTLILSVDGDTDLTIGSGSQMGATSAVTNGTGSTIDVTATQLAFTTQPAGSVSGSALTTQPVVTASDAFGNTDSDFTETVTLTEASAGALTGGSVAAVSGVATFTGVSYTATADQQSFTLTANDQDGVGSDLATIDANSVTSDVVATKLVFTTQPSPTELQNSVTMNFTTDPVVQAQDANNLVDTGFIDTITLTENGAGNATFTNHSVTAVAGIATFTGLTLNHDTDETFQLVADDTAGGTEGDLTGTFTSANITVSSNSVPTLGGTFTTAGTVNDNATTTPFSGVTVTDADGDNVSIHIAFTGANGSLSGTGVTTNGSGDYTVDSAAAATAQSNLRGLIFTPTNNQSATTIVTTFTLTPNDGTADGVANATTQITASAVAPTVTSVSVPGNGTYTAGQNLDFTVNTDEAVTVNTAGGIPALALTIGATGKTASYLSGTGTTALVFRYVIENGLTDTDGISLGGSISLNGGTLKDSGGKDMNTTLNSVGSLASVLVDSSAPTAIFTAATDNVGSVTGTLSSGDTTDDTALVLSGTNESGSTVNVYDGISLLGAATVTGTSWSYTATVADGVTYQFNVVETDAVGNASSATSNFTVIGDTTAPTAVLSTATDNVGTVTGGLSSGDTTDDTALVLSGTNESGSTVNVYNGVSLLGAATVTGTNWSYIATVADGTTYQFNAVETDAAGNTSSASSNFTIIGDTTAPTANFTAATDDAGTITGTLSSGDTTDDTALALTGSNESGSTVNVYNGVTLLGSATVVGTNWSYTATIANGVTYQFNVKETDAAGNTSAATSNFTVTGDTALPGISIVTTDSALKIGDVATLTFTLTESSNNFVIGDITVSGGTLSNFAGSGSSYTADFTPTSSSNASATVDVLANSFTDISGNNNTAATQLTMSVDTLLPSLSSVTIASNNTTSAVAQVGDVITLSFISSEALGSLPTVTIAGNAVTVANTTGNNYEASYTMTATDVIGAVVTFTIDFADSAGNDGAQVTAITSGSNVTFANTAPVNTVLPVISGTASVGSMLSTTNGTWTDANNHTLTYSYQWKADGADIAGATASSYTVSANEAHKTITVVVTAADGNGGNTAATSTGSALSNMAPVNSSVPIIRGSATVGNALSSTTGIWSDADNDTLSYSYRWYRADDASGGNETAIAGATASSYTLTTGDSHKYLRVEVTADDGNGSADQAATSTRTAVTNSAPVNSGLPVISGTAAVGNALSTSDGSWTDADGDTPGYSYQWQADGIDIIGATTNSFSLTTAEAHKSITVVVTADDGKGGSTSVTSAATAIANSVPVNTVPPLISGSAAVGSVLSTSTGSWSDSDNDALTYTYQWKADGADISGASSTSYILTSNELGKVITAVITASDGNGGSTSVTTAATAAIDSDFDQDGIGDATDPDDDNDGMSDVWEQDNGLNPKDATDASTDTDGDGISNLDEFTASSDPNQDDYPPTLTVPADITVDAQGLFTQVTIGSATAIDGLDGDLTPSVTEIVSNGADAKSLSANPTHFAPGVHVLTWSVTDAGGNTASDTQTINVKPLISFSKDQATSEGSTVTFKVILNGKAVTYPVTVSYTISGTAAVDGSDHDLIDGTATINSGTETAISFTTVDDGAGEGLENIVLTMGDPVNAVKGPRSTHRVDLYEGNVAPIVSMDANQPSVSITSTRTIVQNGGPVQVVSNVIDPNPLDTHSFDWSASDNALIDIDSNDESFTFDPSGLAPGLYTVRLAVSDGSDSDVAQVLLNVQATAPVLVVTEDSDGDGSNDQDEGFGDTDGDGIADYLDAIPERNVLQEQVGESASFLIESEPGLALALGKIAFQKGKGQAGVSMDEVFEVDGRRDDASRYDYPSGIFEFSVSELPVAGQSVNVVVAQFVQVPTNAVYRKLMPTGWQDFVEDSNNNVSSAPGEEGYCPPPGDSAYQAGLTEGHWCVQLTIEDGGPNDSDGEVNNSVDDPGGVAQKLADDIEVTVSSKSGGVSPLWLLLMGGFSLARMVVSKRKGASK